MAGIAAEPLHLIWMTGEEVRQCIENNPERVNILDDSGRSVLHAIAFKNDLDLLVWSIERKGAKLLCIKLAPPPPLASCWTVAQIPWFVATTRAHLSCITRVMAKLNALVASWRIPE